MPLYEYQCDACGARFELIRKFSDPPLTTCPKCGAESVRKLVSSPAFQFKGSGWYITDYARKSESAQTAGKASETKTDNKDSAKDSPAPAAPTEKPATEKPAAPATPPELLPAVPPEVAPPFALVPPFTPPPFAFESPPLALLPPPLVLPPAVEASPPAALPPVAEPPPKDVEPAAPLPCPAVPPRAEPPPLDAPPNAD